MTSYLLEEPANPANFDERAYLAANADVAAAVRKGVVRSGWEHFRHFGAAEKRRQRYSAERIATAKAAKLERLRPLLSDDMPFRKDGDGPFDFLDEDTRRRYGIVATDAVASNAYDPFVMEVIERHADGLILDCGAGRREEYFEHVVNLEIVPYETTDVLAAAEHLPFRDASFDAVISIAVLEHLKDPFRCAGEIARVLKPGGSLICVVPFLQPLHGYPNHYYNMTGEGLRNLFSDTLEIESVGVRDSLLPIWSLTWIVQSWARGLSGRAKAEFLDMKLSELLAEPNSFMGRRFVRELSFEKNMELASATMLTARKPA